MLQPNTFKRILSLTLLLTLVLTTMPVSAADLAAAKAIGSVSGAGPVQLRGISITHEGTIFAGDQLSVGSKGYAKVILVQGQKLEMDQMSGVTIAQQGTAVQLHLTSGNVGFTTSPSGSLEIVAGNYQITSDKPMSGNVALIGSDFIGIRMNSGTATLNNIFTKQAIRVPSGEERMLTLQKDPSKAPVAQVASLLPPPIPTVPPVPVPPQAPGTAGGGGSNWLTNVIVVGAVAGTIGLVAYLAVRVPVSASTPGSPALDVKNANSAIAGANSAVASANAAVSAAAAANTAINNSTAVNASTKATLTVSAQNIQAQASATAAQVAVLQTSLNALVAQLQSVTDQGAITAIQTEITGITNSLNADITTLNSLITQLNATISSAAASGVTGLPSTTGVTTITTITLASSSIPKTAS